MTQTVSRSARTRTLRVLIVNDVLEDANHYAMAVLREGWQADIATRATALARAATFQPNVVVIDEGERPSPAVFDLALRVKVERALPVVVLTTLGMPEITRRAQASGCTCVSKPCRAASVITSAQSAVAAAAWGSRRARGGAVATDPFAVSSAVPSAVPRDLHRSHS